jgi:hypothetical protein
LKRKGISKSGVMNTDGDAQKNLDADFNFRIKEVVL